MIIFLLRDDLNNSSIMNIIIITIAVIKVVLLNCSVYNLTNFSSPVSCNSRDCSSLVETHMHRGTHATLSTRTTHRNSEKAWTVRRTKRG